MKSSNPARSKFQTFCIRSLLQYDNVVFYTVNLYLTAFILKENVIGASKTHLSVF